MSWATGAQATTITGQAVTDAQCDAAQYVIELFSDTTQDADADQSPRTLRLLGSAVAYQAAWMIGQIDVMNRIAVLSSSQDGMSFQTDDDDALLLAPLAKRALDRLPWRRSRSVWTGRRGGATRRNQLEAARDNVVLEAEDEIDGRAWRPLHS